MIKRRAPVWAALSDLFVDTDVSIFYSDIVQALRKSRFTPEEVEHILFDEVGPVFYTNLIAENRVWSAWPPEQVRDLVLDFLELPPFQRRAALDESAELVEDIFHEHWPLLRDAAWGGRPKRAAKPRPPARPASHSPSFSWPRLPALRWSRVLVWGPGLLAALVLAFGGYQALALARAKARTPLILQQAWAEAGPPLSRELPVSWIEALIRVEDPGFRRHHGVDFETPGQGMTTITQALVKRLYFRHFSPGIAKIEQSLIARFVLDEAITKEEQLDLFLSLAYFGTQDGRDVIGFRDAATAYYGRALGELDSREFLALVAMLPAPNDLRPGTPQNSERVTRIERMLADECMPSNWADVWLNACAQQ
ncbi:MAG: transglycosylase domain-containing protein [Hyphomonadaceae bacterium]|nr:transglycosylase domain-containing protein [Hyphomonadaceae bacterium]